MSKQKLSFFLKIFFLFFVIQLIIVASHVLLLNAENSLAEITAFMITIISFPISIINSDLPFYSGEGLYFRLIFWTLNLVLQTMVVYGGIRMIKRIK